MEDNTFDSEVKSKLENYEATGFDPTALASLHHQMATVSILPWYRNYRTELLVGSAFLFTILLIIWSQWLFTSRSATILEREIMSLRDQVQEFERLQTERQQTKSMNPDTLKYFDEQDKISSDEYLSLSSTIKRLETALQEVLVEQVKQKDVVGNQENNLASQDEEPLNQKTNLSFTKRISPHSVATESRRAIARNFPIDPASPERNLSTKAIRDIKKHYHKGLSIQVAPVFSLSKGFYNPGNGRFDLSVGLLGDFITSPSISLETGILYTQRHYSISSDLAQRNVLPGIDESLGELSNVDIDSWIYEMPVNIKYRYPISMKANWIAGLGYSTYLYTKQLIEYDYQYNQSASLNSAYTINRAKVYSGTLNLMLGFNSELKNKKILETSIYYQQGLGKMGIEETIPTFVGLRGAYWFQVK